MFGLFDCIYVCIHNSNLTTHVYLQAFTSCSLGVEMVGFVMICFSVCLSISSFVFGMVVRVTGYKLPFIVGQFLVFVHLCLSTMSF